MCGDFAAGERGRKGPGLSTDASMVCVWFLTLIVRIGTKINLAALVQPIVSPMR
jgi:hypothetical protein